MAYRLKSLSSSGGFLKNAPIHFEAGLNTIIGARGTCKSTCVETIRFVFDCDAAKVQALCKTDQADSGDVGGSHAGMLGATLGSGIACCRLTKVDHSDGDEITIEREVGGPSSIYRNGIEELADRDILHMVEIYSQGDLQRIARDPPLRLNLIDRPNQAEIAGLKERRGDVAQQLTTVGRSIRDLNRSIESRQADIRGLGTLRRQLQELQAQRPELSEELEAERSEVGRRNVILDSAKRGASSATETIRRLREATATPIDFAELANEFVANDSVNNQRLAEGFAAMARICADVAKSMEHVDVDILHSAVVHLEAEFDERNKRYYELRREQEEVSDSLKREDGLRKQIAHLERLEHEFQALLVEKDAKLEERSKLRTKLQNITEQIHRLRQVEVERINQLHSEVVTLTLDLGVRSSQYAEEVERLLAGSGIRKQDEVASEVAALFRPCDLIDIVENADAERVAATLERDLRQMTRFVSHLLDSDSLYELEAILFEDSLVLK